MPQAPRFHLSASLAAEVQPPRPPVPRVCRTSIWTLSMLTTCSSASSLVSLHCGVLDLSEASRRYRNDLEFPVMSFQLFLE
ncbi:hypothetical protein Taro_038751 [Colocasia esculenta]|uniref:Uncharacterized protein n=1 Tax=Colocasia esculenta TaxID=4460 RepID=A0A843WTK7_COLES|nr:hypothetical protein [Colocasia esculenta]